MAGIVGGERKDYSGTCIQPSLAPGCGVCGVTKVHGVLALGQQ